MTEDIPGYGVKHDDGKPRWDLLPWREVEEVVKVLTYGAKKYGADNWKMVEADRYFAAALRHLVAYRMGTKRDDDSGLPHLAHAIASLLFIMGLEKS